MAKSHKFSKLDCDESENELTEEEICQLLESNSDPLKNSFKRTKDQVRK